jgi:hypothetical protein
VEGGAAIIALGASNRLTRVPVSLRDPDAGGAVLRLRRMLAHLAIARFDSRVEGNGSLRLALQDCFELCDQPRQIVSERGPEARPGQHPCGSAAARNAQRCVRHPACDADALRRQAAY